MRDDVLGGAAIGAVADHHQLGGHFLANQRENFDHVGDALHRAEIREVHQDRLAIRRPLRAVTAHRPTACKDRS